ncbi:MAG: hypothetical protein QXP38_09505 [Nitrososphaerota archaeon]
MVQKTDGKTDAVAKLQWFGRLTVSYRGYILFSPKYNAIAQSCNYNMFILRHTRVELTEEDIGKAAPKAESRGKTYFALKDGKKIPVKSLLYQALKEKGYDLTLLDFTTADAIRILKRLSIDVRHEIELGKGEPLLKFAGATELGGNAIEDDERIFHAR